MNCVETLARVNVLCVDKTGTITKPEMSVTHVEILDYTYDSGEAVDSHGVERIIKNVAAAISTDNATMEAIHRYYGIDKEKSAMKYFLFHHKTSTVEQGMAGMCICLVHRSICFLIHMIIIRRLLISIQVMVNG